MNKAPDTRNRLDNNKGLKSRKPIKLKKIVTVKDLKEAMDGPLKLNATKKPSKGQLFKEKNGFSKTTKRLMQKNGITVGDLLDVEQYKKIRRTRKKIEKKARQKKHEASLTYRRTHVKDKKAGKSSKKSK